MKKGLYILSITLLAICVLLSVLMLCILTVELYSGNSLFSLLLTVIGGIGMFIFMFEWEIVFPCLVVLLAVIVIAFIYAIRRKMLMKSTVIAIVSINSVTVALIAARVIGWFVIYSML